MEAQIIRPVRVLLAEDNMADVRLTKEALKESKVKINLDVVNNGEEAMDYLKKNGKFKDVLKPDLILLDLNMPRKDGREVLKEVKEDKRLSTIPIVILTVSKNDEDILKTYQLHANCYITKPVDLSQFIEIVKNIESFWFTIVRLPNGIRE